MEMKEKKQVNYQFKLLYAIGMILVVAGHCGGGGVSLFYELFTPYSFHVALFVFCSGYFYKESNEKRIGKYALKKIKTLLIPLYVWNFFYALFAQALSVRGFSIGAGVSIHQLFIDPITSGELYKYNLPTWFIMPLFMAEITNVIYRKFLGIIRHEKAKEIIYIIGAFTAGMLGIFLASRGYNTGMWLAIGRLLHFLPFYALGFMYKKYLEKRDVISNTIYFSVVIGLSLLITLYKSQSLIYEQAWCKFTEFNAWPFIVAILGIAFWLRIARILEPVIGKSKVINLLADNTYSIMANQFLGFMLVKAFFATGYKNTLSLFQDFDWNAYHNDIWYYYIPNGVQQIRIIYVVMALLIPVIIQLLLNKIKNAISKFASTRKINSDIISIGICMVLVITCGLMAYGIANKVSSSGGIKLERTNIYKPDTKLSFDKNNYNAYRYTVSGLSTPEENFTWTNGNSVEFEFVIDSSSDFLLELQCGIYGESQNVEVYVNDRLIGYYVFVSDDIYHMSISHDLLSDDNVLNIKFQLPDAHSPSSVGESEDGRILGLSISSINITEVTMEE